jgi:hypothetical protein
MNIVIKALLAATALMPIAAQAQEAQQPQRQGQGQGQGRAERQGGRGDFRGNRNDQRPQGAVQPVGQRGQAQPFQADRGPDRQTFAADRAPDRGGRDLAAGRQDFGGDRGDARRQGQGRPVQFQDGRGSQGRPVQFQGGQDARGDRGNVIQAGQRGRDDRGRGGDRGNYGGGYGGYAGGAGRGYADNRAGAWNRGWRGDNRYNWNSYRQVNRGAYRLPHYYAPGGWGYGYRRFSIGAVLSSVLWSDNYWIDDPYDYRLPEAYGPYRWVRYYDDAMLVDLRSGRVVDVVYDIFW